MPAVMLLMVGLWLQSELFAILENEQLTKTSVLILANKQDLKVGPHSISPTLDLQTSVHYYLNHQPLISEVDEFSEF